MKNVFFITSAILCPSRSKYTTEERFAQTLETIKSVDKYCPGSDKYLVDSSVEVPDPVMLDQIRSMGVEVVYTGSDSNVNYYSRGSNISIAESYSIKLFLEWFKPKIVPGRMYKLSGRYHLTDRFTPHPFGDKSFVFAEALPSWLPEKYQEVYDMRKLYRTRLWSFDSDIIDTYLGRLPYIINDCTYYGVDVEHASYKHLHNCKVVEMPVIGVSGYTSLSGELIDE